MDASCCIQDGIELPASQTTHLLCDNWVLWAHLPHDIDWSMGSYKKIMHITSVEEIISLYKILPEKMIKNCMLFLMRDGIMPTWEDPKNRNGGCFSYKISNKDIKKTWKETSYCLVGETLSTERKISDLINGITVSPKKSFCILKLWVRNRSCLNPRKIKCVGALTPQGCMFKGHKPVY